MGSKQPKPARPVPPAARALRILMRPQHRGPLLATAVVLAALVGLVVAWNRWGVPTTLGPDYIVTPERILATAQPAWIHTDVKAEVVQTAGLDRLDLRDRKLTEKVARAFALHAWVARVERVEKRFPAQVTVDLVYRRPVAAVEIINRGQPRLLFIDAESILLPSDDFAPNQAQGYLRIASNHSMPAGVYGTPWGDERIAGAARIAAALQEQFAQVELYRIVASEAASGETVYELRTAGDTRVIWGPAPGRESSSGPSVEQKIEALLHYVAHKGPLDRDGGQRLIDLRRLAASRVSQRPAAQVQPSPTQR
ncbi:MAG: hypothetical protein WD872_07075 [Pirellulaceae bacterium]